MWAKLLYDFVVSLQVELKEGLTVFMTLFSIALLFLPFLLFFTSRFLMLAVVLKSVHFFGAQQSL